ncbi:hypothetical protein HDU96_003732, partial [Phlyctochytrium bullatum]
MEEGVAAAAQGNVKRERLGRAARRDPNAVSAVVQASLFQNRVDLILVKYTLSLKGLRVVMAENGLIADDAST